MMQEDDFTVPDWPEALQHVDIVKTRFVLVFSSPCTVQPADFLAIGRVLRLAGRQLNDGLDNLDQRQWESLFRPALSADPVARRKFQKPAPAFVVSMPVSQQTLLKNGDRLDLEVLFLGTGIQSIQDFLRALQHLGSLGLVSGEGRFVVTEMFCQEADSKENLAWSQHQPLTDMTCSVHSLAWLFHKARISDRLTLRFLTPTRLMTRGKPLRKPGLVEVFPFMLRRVTSMVYAHCALEVCDDPVWLLDKVGDLELIEAQLKWLDWRSLRGGPGLSIGGFVGDMHFRGASVVELYWVFAVASLFGIGKGATYGAGKFTLSSR